MSTTLKRIKMPSLTSSGFGSSLSEQFTNIDTNFKILSSLDLTKGETGDSSKFIAFNLNAVFVCDENGYTTETGEETFDTYEYADYIDSSVFSDEIKIVTTKTLYDNWVEQFESNSDDVNSSVLAMMARAEIKVTTTSLVSQVEQDIQTYCNITGNSRAEYISRCKDLLFSDLSSDSCICGVINNSYSGGTDPVFYATTETTYKIIYCAMLIDVSGTDYSVCAGSDGNYYYTDGDGQTVTLYWVTDSDNNYVLSDGNTEYNTTAEVSESEDDLADYDNVLSVYVYDEYNNVYVSVSESSSKIYLYPNWINIWKTLVDSVDTDTAIDVFKTHFACFNPGRIYMACELNQSETVVSTAGVASEITYTASLPYLFIDPRFRSKYMSNIQVSGADDYTDLVDVSSVLIGQTLLNSSNTSSSDDGTSFVFQCCQNSPNIYYNTTTQQFCWVINGQKTDLAATGPAGADGEDVENFGDLYLYSGILVTADTAKANENYMSMYTTDDSSSDDYDSLDVIIGDETSSDSLDTLATISWSNYRYYYPARIKLAESGGVTSISPATYPMSSEVYTAPIVLGNSIADALNEIGSQIIDIALAADEIYESLAKLTSHFEGLTSGWSSGLDIGGPTNPVYVSSGTITAFNGVDSTAGGADTPVWLDKGEITRLSETVGSVDSPVYLKEGTITECGDVFVLKDCSMSTLSVSPTVISVGEISGKTLEVTIITQDSEEIAPGSSEAVNCGLVVKWEGVNAAGITVLEEVESSEITIDDVDDEYGLGSCLYINRIVKFNLYYNDKIIDTINVEVPTYSLILDTNYVMYMYIDRSVSYIPECVNLVIQKTVGTGNYPGYIEVFEPGSTAATRENITFVSWSGYTYNGDGISGEITSSSLYIGAEDSEAIDSNTTTLAGALVPGKSSAETTSGIVTITATSNISGLSIDPVYIYSTNSVLDLHVSISNVAVLEDEIYSSGYTITSFEVYVTNNVTGDNIYPGSAEAEELGLTITWSSSDDLYTGTLTDSTVNVTDTDDSGSLSLYQIWADGDTVTFYLNFTSDDTTCVLDKYSLVPSEYYLGINLTSISADAEGNITFTWEEGDSAYSTTFEIPDSGTSDTYGKISLSLYDATGETIDLDDNDLTITWTCGDLTGTVGTDGELYITYELITTLVLGYSLVFELYDNSNPNLIIDTVTITPDVEETFTYELEVDPSSTTISSTSAASSTRITVHVLKTSSTGTTSILYASGYTDLSSGNYVTYNYTFKNGTSSSEYKFIGSTLTVSLKLDIVAVNFYLYADDEQTDSATVDISYEVNYNMTVDPLYVGLTYDDDGEVVLVVDSLSIIITKTKLGTTTELTTYSEFISELGDPDEMESGGFILKATGYDVSGNARSTYYTSETISLADTGESDVKKPGHWLLYGDGSITFTATGTSTDSYEAVTLTATVNVCPYDLQVTGTPSFDIDAYGDIIVRSRSITVYIRNVEDTDDDSDSTDSTNSSSATLIIPGSTTAVNNGLTVTYDAYDGSTVTLNTYNVNVTSMGTTNNVYYNILNNGYVMFNLYYDGNLITSVTVEAATYSVGVYPDTLYVTSNGFFDSSACDNEVDSVLVSLIVYNPEGDDSEGYIYKDFSVINDNSGYLLWSGLTTSGTTLSEEIDVSSIPDSYNGVVKLSISDIDYSGNISDCGAEDAWTRVICNKNSSSSIIFTANDGYKNIASDTLTVKNTITNSSSSDIRLKKNIELIGERVLDKLSNISLKSFDMIANGDHRYGVIAQELESEGLNELVKYDAAGYRSVDYTSLLILENELLKRKLAALEGSIAEIKEIVLPPNTGEN